MTKVIAITEIHRTVEPGAPGDKQKGIAPVKPTVQIIPPGSIIETTGSELADLRRLKAVRDPLPGEKIGVSISADDTDSQVQAKIAAARAGIVPAGEEQGDDGKGSVPQTDTKAAKKAAAAAKAAEAAGDSNKSTTKATAKPASGSSETSGDDTSNLV